MLFGKNIVITGAASGIGARTAELASQMGANVICIDINTPKHHYGTFLAGDLSSAEGVAKIVDMLPKEIHALCNVAGVSGEAGADITLRVNFFGLKMLSESIVEKMFSGGSIINVASIAGYGWRTNAKRASAIAHTSGFPENMASFMEQNDIANELGYPISKEALLVWTQLASQQALFKDKSIRVNAVSPGPVETPIINEFRAVLGDDRVNADINKVGRPATPSDIAPAICFLCSDGARWINGHNLATDGGLEAVVNKDTFEL